MRDGPGGAVLLAIARTTLLEEILPHVEPAQSYAVRMIANAMAIAGRELAVDREATETEARRRLGAAYRDAGIAEPQAGLSLSGMERRLAHDVREGRFDGYDAALVPLLAWQVRGRLALSNPKALTPPLSQREREKSASPGPLPKGGGGAQALR